MNYQCGGKRAINHQSADTGRQSLEADRKNGAILTFLVFIAAAIVVFATLGSVYLFDVDEAVFAQASKEMLLSGDWINPTYNGINRYDKPILIYWLMIASYKLFGVNEFAARLPSAVSALLLALIVYRFVLRQISQEAANFALISLVFSPYFLVYSRAAVTDMTLTLFITLSLFSFYNGSGPKNSVGFHAFSALAFLTKGLIGIVFPFGIALSYILFARQWHRMKVVFSPIGIAVFILIALPWYAVQYQRNGMEFIEQFFFKHHLQRYTDVISGHSGPFYYYFIALFAGLLPWGLLLSAAFLNAWYKRAEVFGFALLWLLFVVFFFSLSTTKLPNYILPSIPAAVLVLSGVYEKVASRWFKLLIAALSLVSAIALFFAPSLAIKYGITDMQWVYWIILINICTFLLMLVPERHFTITLMPQGLAFLMFLLFLAIAIKGLPLAGERLQGSLYKFSHYAKQNLRADERVFIYKINQPSIVFYSDRRVVRAGSYEEADSVVAQYPIKIAVTKMKHEADMLRLGFKLKEAGQDYGLFER